MRLSSYWVGLAGDKQKPHLLLLREIPDRVQERSLCIEAGTRQLTYEIQAPIHSLQSPHLSFAKLALSSCIRRKSFRQPLLTSLSFSLYSSRRRITLTPFHVSSPPLIHQAGKPICSTAKLAATCSYTEASKTSPDAYQPCKNPPRYVLPPPVASTTSAAPAS